MAIKVGNDVKNQKLTPALYADVYANIPAPGQTGRLFFATDTKTIYRDSGSSWDLFLNQTNVPGGLSPIGTPGQLLRVNLDASALEYFNLDASVIDAALGYAPVGGSGESLYLAIWNSTDTQQKSSIKQLAPHVPGGDISYIVGDFTDYGYTEWTLRGDTETRYYLETPDPNSTRFAMINSFGDIALKCEDSYDNKTLLRFKRGFAGIPNQAQFGSWKEKWNSALSPDSQYSDIPVGSKFKNPNFTIIASNAYVPIAFVPVYPRGYYLDGLMLNNDTLINFYEVTIGNFKNVSYLSLDIDGANQILIPNTAVNLTSLYSSVQMLGGVATGLGLTIASGTPLQTISMQALVISDVVSITAGSLTSLSLPNLSKVRGNFEITAGSLTSLNLPSLTYTTNFNLNMASLSNLILTNYTKCAGNMQWQQLNGFGLIADMPSLQYIYGQLNVISSSGLTTINLPSIISINSFNLQTASLSFTSGTPNLTNFTLGSNLKQVGEVNTNSVLFTSCALNQASVDNILIRLAALNGSGGTVTFSNRTVTITGTSSAPSGAGIIAKNTLISRGCTVTTN